jgi:hypothetical protein
MNGGRVAPTVVASNSLAYPKNYARQRSLQWFTQEVEELIKKYSVQSIVIKRSEGRTKGRSFEERVEYEAAVYLAAARCCVTAISKKVKSTIAKDLGLKGRAHYLQTGLDTSLIPGYSQYTEKEQEAIICAWSDLK